MTDPLVEGPYPVVVATLLGALLGSFLNVCIVRWGAEPKQSVLHPRRSHCPACGMQITARDNVPILSWLLLGGRCRRCRTPISPMYPLVEAAVAAIWGWAAWRYGVQLEALRAAVFLTLLLGIACTDFRAYLIPDEFTWGGLALGLAFALADGLAGLGTALLGAAVGFGLLYAVGAVGSWLLKQDAMGGGDIKMMAMVGAFTGWPGVLLTIFLGSVLGTLIFLPLRLAGRTMLVPFGIFLALGAAAALLAGPALIGWYLGVVGFT